MNVLSKYQPVLESVAPVAVAFIAALALTPLVRAAARRLGAVAHPAPDRWHLQPTALMGGTAVVLAFGCGVVFLAPSPEFMVILAASLLLWLMGLVDDFRTLKPYQKLVAQLIAAMLVVSTGTLLKWTPSEPVNLAVTLFWLVGVTNAVNLLDNMDGLAAGVSAIAAAFLGGICYLHGQMGEAALLAVFAAALLGFLVFNFNPASIFMGDCGSQFCGFFLAASALLSGSGGRSRGLVAVLAVPVLVLLIPIFDTTLVTIMRKLSGRRISHGGPDHASHRLVAVGLSERRAVVLLYAFAVASGALALMLREMPLDVALAAIGAGTVGLTLLAVHLARVRVYDDDELAREPHRPLMTFMIDLSYKRRIFEVLLDAALIVLAYYLANALLYGSLADSGAWPQFVRVLSVLLVVKLVTFLAMGVYRGVWRYIGLDDLFVYAKAVGLSSLLGVAALLLAHRFVGLSRTVFILDAVFLFLLVSGSRLAFRLFRRLLPTQLPPAGRRILIYGAGDGGELLLREIRNNPGLDYAPVGFLDDDPLKLGKRIHGLRVMGGNGAFLTICRRHAVEEVLISSSRLSGERLRDLARNCREDGLVLKRLSLTIEHVNGSEDDQFEALPETLAETTTT